MNQVEARRAAQTLQRAGYQVIADNLGGWSGQPKSQVWGVRHMNLRDLYTSIQEMPKAWADTLKSSE